MEDIKLSLDYYGGYVTNIFAMVISGHVVLENVTMEDIFSSIESFYQPEFTDFIIQVWYNNRWNDIQ